MLPKPSNLKINRKKIVLSFELGTLNFVGYLSRKDLDSESKDKGQNSKYKDLSSKFEKFRSSGKVSSLCKITILFDTLLRMLCL